jgi:peptide/nickel transport system permease protein
MGLREYVVRRIFQLVLTLWAFVTVLFVLFRMVPGDPTSRFVMEYPTPEQREARVEELGLNEPMYVQYIEYMSGLLRGDFGDSTHYREPVGELIFPLFLNTIVLMFTALLLAYTFGVLFGAAMGWYRGSRFERGGIVATLVARSSPEFWIGIILVWLFVYQLGLLPRAGIGGYGGELTMNVVDRYLNLDFLRHLILPALTGAIFYMATPALLMRNTMLEVLKADFIEIKKAEGLPERTVLYKHAARNSVLPLVTVMAIATGAAMGGSVIIETVFNWPGIGREMVDAVTRNDYPMAMATFFFMGTAVIVMNFVADLAYLYLDPRVKYE